MANPTTKVLSTITPSADLKSKYQLTHANDPYTYQNGQMMGLRIADGKLDNFDDTQALIFAGLWTGISRLIDSTVVKPADYQDVDRPPFFSMPLNTGTASRLTDIGKPVYAFDAGKVALSAAGLNYANIVGFVVDIANCDPSTMTGSEVLIQPIPYSQVRGFVGGLSGVALVTAATGGAAGTTGTAGAGSAITETSGAGGTATTGTGGAGGAASTTAGAGGATSGAAGTGGAGGAASLAGGAGGATAGSGASTAGAGGGVNIAGGVGGAAAAGTGNGGAGGSITLTPGAGGTSAGGTAGAIGAVVLGGPVRSPVTAAQAIATGNTITLPTSGQNKLLSVAAASTGVIMTPGRFDGETVRLFNTSAANTVTFAAAGTSNVADGATAVIAVVSSMTLTWDATSARWYHGN